MRKFKYFLTFSLASLVLVSCESLLDKKPEGEDQILEEDAIKTVNDLQALLVSVYDVQANLFGGQIQNLSELLGDNNTTPVSQDDYTQVYNRRTDFFNGTISSVYADAYRAIYRANTLLDKVDDVSDVPAADYDRIRGEALFHRGLNHFYLVRIFAQPYGYTSDNSHLGITLRTTPSQVPLGRNTVQEVYNQIITDLTAAENLLPETNGIYANKDAATALLAKVYLQMMNYTDAEAKATAVINSSNGYALDDLDRFAHGTSSERIFTLVSTPAINDLRAKGWLDNYRSDNNDNPRLKSSDLLFAVATTDTNDQRGQEWFTLKNAGASNEIKAVSKFDYTEADEPILHLAEMLLIRAEALGRLDQNLTQAEMDINEVRNRAGLPDVTITSGAEAAAFAISERRIELCFEGERVHVLKRMGVMGEIDEIRGAPWDCPGMVLQFPNSEITYPGFVLNPEAGCD